MSRRDASTSKVQYLLHLKECHFWCARACRTSAATAQRLHGEIALPCSRYRYDLRGELHALNLDLDYLADELEKSILRVEEVKDLTMMQMELFEKRRSRIIGLLVAIYVPLAFATVSSSLQKQQISTHHSQSFFGMNIQDSSTIGYWTNSTARSSDFNGPQPYTWSKDNTKWYRNHPRYEDPNNTDWRSWHEYHNPEATANMTSLSFTKSNVPGTRTWPLWMFWTVACTLTLGSIVLPIIGGRVSRFLARLSITYRRIFRTLAAGLWLA